MRTIRGATGPRSGGAASPVAAILLVLLAAGGVEAAGSSGCGVLTADVSSLNGCQASIRFSLDDPAANLDPGAVETVPIHVRSAVEPFGEILTLTETGPDTGLFVGSVPVSAQSGVKGVISLVAGDVTTIVGSRIDPDCDQDSDGQTGENDFTDVDGDGAADRGANGVFDLSCRSGIRR